MSLLRDLRLPCAGFPVCSLTQEHWLSVQCFLLIILVLSAQSKDHSLPSGKPFSIGTIPPGLPAEAAPWRATPLSESIKAQLPRAEWPRCLPKRGKDATLPPRVGAALLWPGQLTTVHQFNKIKSSTRGEVRKATRGKAVGRQLRKPVVPAQARIAGPAMTKGTLLIYTTGTMELF